RGARRDDARAAERRASPDLARERVHRRLRDALDRGGRLPVDARRDHVSPTRTDRARDPDRSAAAADGGDARGPAVLRARDRGARGAAHGRRPRYTAGRDGSIGGCGVSAQPVAAAAPARRSNAVSRQLREWLPAAVVLAAALGLWEAVVKGAHV